MVSWRFTTMSIATMRGWRRCCRRGIRLRLEPGRLAAGDWRLAAGCSASYPSPPARRPSPDLPGTASRSGWPPLREVDHAVEVARPDRAGINVTVHVACDWLDRGRHSRRNFGCRKALVAVEIVGRCHREHIGGRG